MAECEMCGGSKTRQMIRKPGEVIGSGEWIDLCHQCGTKGCGELNLHPAIRDGEWWCIGFTCPDCQEKPESLVQARGIIKGMISVLLYDENLSTVQEIRVAEQLQKALKLLATESPLADRIEELEPLLEACQGAIIIINELTTIIDDFVKAKDLPAFPHPPIDGIKQAITNAGGVIFETTEQAKAALGKEAT